MNPQDQQKLEQWVGRAVRDLPARRAPASLESRVQAEIARRAALPWWRKSFAHWPMAARAGFVTASAAIVALFFSATLWAAAGVSALQIKAASAPAFQAAQTGVRLIGNAGEFAMGLVGSIPALWLYGGAAVIVALYVALFGLGAAAYRTLYASN